MGGESLILFGRLFLEGRGGEYIWVIFLFCFESIIKGGKQRWKFIQIIRSLFQIHFLSSHIS